MGIFSKLFRNESAPADTLVSPAAGRTIDLSEVPDPTFGEEILGKGIAIIPSDGRVYAPADGVVSTVFPTGHAVGVTTPDGAELLIHIGLDTVELKGEPFTIKVSADQNVKKGDLLIEADLEKIKASGKDTITPMVICNSDNWTNIESFAGRDVEPGDEVMKLSK